VWCFLKSFGKKPVNWLSSSRSVPSTSRQRGVEKPRGCTTAPTVRRSVSRLRGSNSRTPFCCSSFSNPHLLPTCPYRVAIACGDGGSLSKRVTAEHISAQVSESRSDVRFFVCSHRARTILNGTDLLSSRTTQHRCNGGDGRRTGSPPNVVRLLVRTITLFHHENASAAILL
jgi:hypothetical protein